MENRENDIVRDPLFFKAGKLILEKRRTTFGLIQRSFKIGFSRALIIMEQLENAGVIGPEAFVRDREILMSLEQFEKLYGENGNV